MTVWDYSFTIRQFILDFAAVSALLLLATGLRRYVPLLQRYLVPNNLTAGFIGLLLGPELLGLLDIAPERMGVYVYHLLALTFISVGLQRHDQKASRVAVNLGFIQIMSMLLQATIGLGVALLIAYLINPAIIPQVGMLLPLSFANGPGLAFSVGQSWEAYGFEGAGPIGLTLAAIGFLVAYIAGMILVNRGIRRGETQIVHEAALLDRDTRTGLIEEHEPEVGARLTTSSGAIEPLTYHLALIGGIYFATYFVVQTLAYGLVSAGLTREVPTLWSFHFLVANGLALLVRRVLDRTDNARSLDDGFIQRTTGFFVDYLIAASIMGISLSVAWDYIVPIILMATLATIGTYIGIRWASKRLFDDYPFERSVGMFGQMTGTISSGLALLRVTDPRLTTTMAQDQALSTGFALLFGFPLLVAINIPLSVFDGRMVGYWVCLGIFAAYAALLSILWWRYNRKRPAA
ncbi:MAG: hypothetical protein RhofKO_43640 [Rhodothermales bacterium]